MQKTNPEIIPVSIVGAGPGDPDLLTLKAHKKITQADIILTDSLVSDQILALAKHNCKIINVGKRYGDFQDQTDRQLKINQLMVKHALEGSKVVRLKSGDPFIFSRGVEEIKYLIDHQVPYEVVPGITAGIAAANLHAIPLTERNKTTSVLFCTGHTANYDYEQLEGVANLLKSGASVVMYMGLKLLAETIKRLIQRGVADDTLVSAVSKVSSPEQKLHTFSFGQIDKVLNEDNIEMPVVFIIGQNAYPVN
jgi:uroporphyrin-III C-methyltransferase